MPLPESTYRLQFHKGFTFADATALVPYLRELGVTHLYASPYLKATPGSTHGYDVVDHTQLNPELGARADYDALCDALSRHGLTHVVDIVPNHVGIATNDNPWWNDVLKHGPDSNYARFFDITWEGSPRPQMHGRVLLPILGDPYNDVLERGELKVVRDGDGFAVTYFDRRFPIATATEPVIRDAAPGKPVERAIEVINGTPGDAASFDRLDELLTQQFYRLAWWKIAPDEIDYRRFFDVNSLAALAMERQEVFDATHALIFDLIRQGKIDGLRIDHPDGLYDPKQYLDRLQSRAAEVGKSPLYVVVEKILAVDEPLLRTWPCDGTTGYDFLNVVNGLFVDSRNEAAYTAVYQEFVGRPIDFDELVYEKKKLILNIALASELTMLARQLDEIAQGHRATRDFSLRALREGLRELIACFPVYRTYVTDAGHTDEDVRRIDAAVAKAVQRNPAAEPATRFVRAALLGETHAHRRFAGKFQQLTSPTTAKGIEDTAFYIYNRFVSLNEVGGEPSHFGTAPDAAHAYLSDRATQWPHALSALSTHDTKRSEDVRARLNVLSELPDAWREQVTRWREINAARRGEIDPNDEYLLYQTLVGVWPLEGVGVGNRAVLIERVQAYMTKAMREAKVHTMWTDVNAAYEKQVSDLIASLIEPQTGAAFLATFEPFVKRLARIGLVNSLAQTTLKLAAPGAPDTYQGCELWDFSLVDPDNRRPVDYAARRELLRSLDGADTRTLFDSAEDGRIKLLVTQRLLAARREHPGLFSQGEYTPLRVAGALGEHVFAFLRRHEGHSALVAVTRLPASLADGHGRLALGTATWQDARLTLPEGSATTWHDVLTGRSLHVESGGLKLADVLGELPVAVLLA
jgi:(1->4)-alpha-D-glucan 1-alpha-D-glucosylmutase